MLRSVRVTRVGDTDFLVDEQVDRFRFTDENERVMNRGGEPADGTALLLGIANASLSTDSFISAASFQETTRVLTEASIAGRVDHLHGIKERYCRLPHPGRHRNARLPRGLPRERRAHPGSAQPRRPPPRRNGQRDEEAVSLADFDDEIGGLLSSLQTKTGEPPVFVLKTAAAGRAGPTPDR